MSSFTVDAIEFQLRQRLGTIQGTDTNGDDYHSLTELWDYIFHAQSIKQKNQKRRKKGSTQEEPAKEKSGEANEWYHKAFEYWESAANCPISDDGVLGGYGKLTPMDVRDSNVFLDKMQERYPGFQLDTVADCGAGIGRVTKFLLLPRSKHVDLIEQSPRLLASAPSYIGIAEDERSRIGLIEKGLQDFAPEENSYDLIWIQWVIGHLHDQDFVHFFRRCAKGLKANGFIILKDNTIIDRKLTFSLDLEDNSVARNLEYQKLLFDLAGLEVVEEQQQTDFPEELYPVFMIALRPKARA